ncbi:MAG TPA: Gp49 family protein [Rhodocyclaceae bacterium]|nr:Gp49 family protein [Rhodocyclaceae bacterium]
MTDITIEQEIQAKGLTAPRITPDDVEANIFREYFFTADQGATIGIEGVTPYTSQDRIDPLHPSLSLLTFCVLVLRNGFTVTGESACASPENFDAELGRKIARQNAISKVWPLMGYELRSKLAGG